MYVALHVTDLYMHRQDVRVEPSWRTQFYLEKLQSLDASLMSEMWAIFWMLLRSLQRNTRELKRA